MHQISWIKAEQNTEIHYSFSVDLGLKDAELSAWKSFDTEMWAEHLIGTMKLAVDSV